MSECIASERVKWTSFLLWCLNQMDQVKQFPAPGKEKPEMIQVYMLLLLHMFLLRRIGSLFCAFALKMMKKKSRTVVLPIGVHTKSQNLKFVLNRLARFESCLTIQTFESRQGRQNWLDQDWLRAYLWTTAYILPVGGLWGCWTFCCDLWKTHVTIEYIFIWSEVIVKRNRFRLLSSWSV